MIKDTLKALSEFFTFLFGTDRNKRLVRITIFLIAAVLIVKMLLGVTWGYSKEKGGFYFEDKPIADVHFNK